MSLLGHTTRLNNCRRGTKRVFYDVCVLKSTKSKYFITILFEFIFCLSICAWLCYFFFKFIGYCVCIVLREYKSLFVPSRDFKRPGEWWKPVTTPLLHYIFLVIISTMIFVNYICLFVFQLGHNVYTAFWMSLFLFQNAW